jgi:hypothetical protein
MKFPGVVLGGDEQLEASFSVVSGRFDCWVVLEGTAGA